MKTQTLSLATKNQNPATAFIASTADASKTWHAPSLREVCEGLMESGHDEEAEPVTIQMPDGRSLAYHMVLAHYCYAEGRINEEEFVNESENRLN